MLIYCLQRRKNPEFKNPKVVRTKNGRIMLLSKCEVCNSTKSKFLKEQKTRGLSSSLGIRNTFKSNTLIRSSFVLKYITNEIINKF